MSRYRWAIALILLASLGFLVDSAEGGCYKHKHYCPPPATATVPVPSPTMVVPTITPVPEEEIDSCYFHPTNPCSEATPVATVQATPVVTATAQPPVYDVFILTPPEVQLPPSGIVPGAPNTGSAGLKYSDVEFKTYMPAPQWRVICWWTTHSVPRYYCVSVRMY